MPLSHILRTLAGAALIASLFGCQTTDRDQPPPPDARRPTLKTQEQLASERSERLASGKEVATKSPDLRPTAEQPPVAAQPKPVLQPTPGAIQGDILMVDDVMLTAHEVLYPLWDDLVRLRRSQTRAGFQTQARETIGRETQRQIGTLLVYSEAMAQLEDEQKSMLGAYVNREVEAIQNREHGGSAARLHAHLAERGLTLDQLRGQIQRQMVVQQYTREKLFPKVRPTRGDLLTYYRRNIDKYSTPATRELRMIELPYAAFLPDGQAWSQASRQARAQAKLQARRQARAAHEALRERPFAEVAREFSRGLHVEDGGSYGPIGRPLQPPYDGVSGLIFDFEEGQYSEPIELEMGWFIVQCGAIQAATQTSFYDAQDEIREALMNERFARLSIAYILELAETATISSMDSFVYAAVQRADEVTAVLAQRDQE